MNHIYFNPAWAQREQQRREQRIARARAAVAEVQAQVDGGRLKKVSVIRQRAKKRLKKHKVHGLFAVKVDAERQQIINQDDISETFVGISNDIIIVKSLRLRRQSRYDTHVSNLG
jgi:transposase